MAVPMANEGLSGSILTAACCFNFAVQRRTFDAGLLAHRLGLSALASDVQNRHELVSIPDPDHVAHGFSPSPSQIRRRSSLDYALDLCDDQCARKAADAQVNPA